MGLLGKEFLEKAVPTIQDPFLKPFKLSTWIPCVQDRLHLAFRSAHGAECVDEACNFELKRPRKSMPRLLSSAM